LFAEYFDKRAVYNLLGQFQRAGYENFEIDVVTSDNSKILEMKADFQLCQSVVQFQTEQLRFESVSIDSFFDLENVEDYDYIEYNGGVSIDPNFSNHLRLFRDHLSEDGVIGLTYFSNNSHVRELKGQIDKMQVKQFIPFSLETKRLIKEYLEMNRLGLLANDEHLMYFLGAEPRKRAYPPKSVEDLAPAVNWKAYKRQDIREILDKNNLTGISWVPTAYSFPYGTIIYLLSLLRSLFSSDSFNS
jgi:hypothetical protein